MADIDNSKTHTIRCSLWLYITGHTCVCKATFTCYFYGNTLMGKKNEIMTDMERIVEEVLHDSEITKRVEETIRRQEIQNQKDRDLFIC